MSHVALLRTKYDELKNREDDSYVQVKSSLEMAEQAQLEMTQVGYNSPTSCGLPQFKFYFIFIEVSSGAQAGRLGPLYTRIICVVEKSTEATSNREKFYFPGPIPSSQSFTK